MRSYRQYCGLARALDVIGERWSLLIVRELLDGPRRYNELLEGLPGIATNLLTDRLRNLEADGVLRRLDDGRYALTEWGDDLREAVYALGRWAGPLMARPRGDDHFHPSWMRHMVVARFDGVDPKRTNLTVELRCDDEPPITLVSADGRVQVLPDRAAAADITLTGPSEPVVGVLLGRIDRRAAERRGVAATGDLRRLAGLRPRGEAPSRARPTSVR
jgi:DNA-binding HxlR family transcriptional regulator